MHAESPPLTPLTDSSSPPANEDTGTIWVRSRAAAKRAPRTRWLVGLALAGATTIAASWVGIRTFPWFGPMLADGLRSAVGSQNVTRLEELVAGVEDRVQSVTSNAAPRGLRDATPPELLAAVAPEPATAGPAANRPKDVGALFARVASDEDGLWQPVPLRAGDAQALYRTIIHPDPERRYAELFVFALDLSKLELQAVAGSVEPKTERRITGLTRPGMIPPEDHGRLVAAFNGGFKVEHGQFGMMVDETVLVPPRPTSCTFGELSGGGLTIAPWTKLSAEAFAWWRQTPACMLEDGVLHPGLRTADSKNWGATLEGKTVIRRSAVGLDAEQKTLFVGISNATTARALALGMQHAGAVTVAQLDVNHSYPRFLLYRDEGDRLVAQGAVKDLLYGSDEYVGRASSRDFFYVTAR